jgi:hypothetical protein
LQRKAPAGIHRHCFSEEALNCGWQMAGNNGKLKTEKGKVFNKGKRKGILKGKKAKQS